MQNKSSTQQSDAAIVEDEETDKQEILMSSSDTGPVEEDDPEEAELKKEALRVAQDAVSKQKKITSAFDSECDRLRQTGEPEASQEVAGASNIDLHNPLVLHLILPFSLRAFLLQNRLSRSWQSCCVSLIESMFLLQFHHASDINCSDTTVV